MRKITLLLLLLFVGISINAEESVKLYGVRAYDNLKPTFEIVTFDSSDPKTVDVLKDQPVTEAKATTAYTAGYAKGHLYIYTSAGTYPNGFAKIAIDDWSMVSWTPYNTTTFMPYDMAYDPITDKMYILSINLTTLKSDIQTVDLSTGEPTLFKELDDMFGTIAFDSEGKLYGITLDFLTGAEISCLKSINLEDGTSTLIASMDLYQSYNQSMMFDSASGKLFWAFHGELHRDGRLFEIDPTTGQKTDLGVLGKNSQIIGLFTTLFPEEFSPAAGSEEIDIFTPPTVTFNKAIEAADLTAISITPAVANTSASIEGNQLSLAHDNFDFSTEYTVTVPKTALKDLDYDISWSFKTLPNPENCNPPSQLKAEEVLPYSVSLSWKENGAATAWNIKYGASGFDIETEGNLIEEVDARSYTISELDELTTYDVYVQAICYAGIPSDWSNVCSFSTPMDCDKPHTVFPWKEDFEGETFPSECWSNYDVDNAENREGIKYEWARVPNTECPTCVLNGTYSVSHAFDLNVPQEGWLVTKKFGIPAGDDAYILRFWDMNLYAEEYLYNGIWISEGSPDPADGDFVEVWTPMSLSKEWREEKVNLSDAYAGKNIYIAFVYKAKGAPNGLITSRWYIDDMSIDTYSNKDMQLLSIDEPKKGGAGLSASSEVKVTLFNSGSEPVSNIPITLTINGETVAKETVTNTINSLSPYQYTFTKKVNFAEVGTYVIDVAIEQEGDKDPDNNRVEKTIISIPSEPVTLFGYSVFRYPVPDNTFISFSTKDLSALTDLAQFTDDENIATAGEYLNGRFYMYTQNSSYSNKHFIVFDANTWTEIERKDVAVCPYEMTYDYSTRTMYAVAPSLVDETSDLYIVNTTTGKCSFIASLDAYVYALACDLDGQLYAVLSKGVFCSIEKTTGDITIIRETGHESIKFVQSMAFDHNTGRLFWTMVGDGPNSGVQYGGMAEIDKKTGASFHHGKIFINTQIIGLHTPYTHLTDNIVKVEKDKLEIYPNPSDGDIYLTVADNSLLKVMDISGRLVNTYTVNTGRLSLDLPQGVYLLQLESEGKIYTNKLIIQ